MRCRDEARAEPLAGTAPRARWWWLIEVPGPWGRTAVADCRVAAVRSLPSTDERRVLLIRPRGRHPAADPDAPLRVWFAGSLPGDPPPRRADLVDHTELHAWPPAGPPPERAVVDPQAPVLAVCANSARDLCCGLDGRALVHSLDDDRVWECSHLGGHRFAPTALLVGTGLVYGRLDTDAARSLMDMGPTPDTAAFLRGRSSLAPPAQAAEASHLARGIRPDPATVEVDDVTDGLAHVGFAGMSPVEVRLIPGEHPRAVSCGAAPEPWSAWRT
jgi:hypothetical protein